MTAEVWACDQPAPGVAYRVVREAWLEDGTRLIFQVEVGA